MAINVGLTVTQHAGHYLPGVGYNDALRMCEMANHHYDVLTL